MFRERSLFVRIVEGIEAASKDGFRVVHFSVQSNHIHLLVEAASSDALSSGMRGLAIRLARIINRELGRAGRVWADRWHGRALKSPREVRNALAYVLFNGRKHGVTRGALDPMASIYWDATLFDLQTFAVQKAPSTPRRRPTAPARTWLLAHGWRRRGPLSARDVPRVIA